MANSKQYSHYYRTIIKKIIQDDVSEINPVDTEQYQTGAII